MSRVPRAPERISCTSVPEAKPGGDLRARKEVRRRRPGGGTAGRRPREGRRDPEGEGAVTGVGVDGERSAECVSRVGLGVAGHVARERAGRDAGGNPSAPLEVRLERVGRAVLDQALVEVDGEADVPPAAVRIFSIAAREGPDASDAHLAPGPGGSEHDQRHGFLGGRASSGGQPPRSSFRPRRVIGTRLKPAWMRMGARRPPLTTRAHPSTSPTKISTGMPMP